MFFILGIKIIKNDKSYIYNFFMIKFVVKVYENFLVFYFLFFRRKENKKEKKEIRKCLKKKSCRR